MVLELGLVKMRKKGKHTWLGYLFRLAMAGLFIGVMLILLCNYLVKAEAKGKLYNDVNEIPYRKVGLVLGTSPYNARGGANQYYNNRMKATVQLYAEHKISYILVSGDNHRHEYNEPEYMKRSLIEMGVPDSVIFLDYAGFRTFDSMVRAKKVFGQDSVTVISQAWHNERAIYIAQHHELEAIGFNATDVQHRKSYLKNHAREALAKTKVVLDMIFNKQPKFLGEPIPIP